MGTNPSVYYIPVQRRNVHRTGLDALAAEPIPAGAAR
jgi:hypothetical protein